MKTKNPNWKTLKQIFQSWVFPRNLNFNFAKTIRNNKNNKVFPDTHADIAAKDA